MQQMFAEVETKQRQGRMSSGHQGKESQTVFCKGLELPPCQGAAVHGKLQVTTGAWQPCKGQVQGGSSDILNCFQTWFMQSWCQRGG